MMLAAVARIYHWPQAELLELTDEDIRFWLQAATDLRKGPQDG